MAESKKRDTGDWSAELEELGPGVWGRKVPDAERKLDPEFVMRLAKMSGSEEYKRLLNELLASKKRRGG